MAKTKRVLFLNARFTVNYEVQVHKGLLSYATTTCTPVAQVAYISSVAHYLYFASSGQIDDAISTCLGSLKLEYKLDYAREIN
jgi:hypothetical protein